MKKRSLRMVAAVAVALLFAITTPRAEAGERLVLVELFTAQGCPICPQADAFLVELAKRPDVLALSFHVDYWDYIGWKDPFADPANTRRQQNYADRHGLPYVFTPQMVVDGAFQGSGNDRSRIVGYIDSAAVLRKPWIDVSLTRVDTDKVHVQLPSSTGYRGEAEVVLVRFDRGHRTKVSRGENKGRKLKNIHVVRQFRPITTWRGEAVSLTVPLEDLGGVGVDFVAVIVQEVGQGQVIGVAKLDLRGGS